LTEEREVREGRGDNEPRDTRDPRGADDPRDVRDPRKAGDPRDVRDVREARQPRSMWVAIIAILLLVLVSVGTLAYIYLQVISEPDFRFTEAFYEASPGWVCPGDVISWRSEIEVSGNVPPTMSTTIRSWVNPETGATIAAASLGDATSFVWGDWPGAADYYKEHFGVDVVQTTYPYRAVRVLTATIPANAPYDSPLMLVTSTLSQRSARARYAVPVYVLSREACDK
jgi:hypothetical protein